MSLVHDNLNNGYVNYNLGKLKLLDDVCTHTKHLIQNSKNFKVGIKIATFL